jgi:hypothetical protein
MRQLLVTRTQALCVDVDDDEALNRQPNASLGEISVQVQRTIVTDLSRLDYTHSSTLCAGSVHERSKKAGAHSIRYIGVVLPLCFV